MDLTWKHMIVIIIVALVIAWLAENKTMDWVYDLGCCSINDYNCTDCSGWDGICTQEIKDECCEPVRVCAGQLVDDPLDCYDDYCWNVGEKCVPEYDVATTKYKCTCMTVSEML